MQSCWEMRDKRLRAHDARLLSYFFISVSEAMETAGSKRERGINGHTS